MDKIILTDLAVLYRVGVPDKERSRPQKLWITVELETDFSAAASKDDLSGTIDYYAVMKRLLRFGDGREWKLIETLAADIAQMILLEFGPKAVSVRIKKFILPEMRHVSVEIRREKT